MTTFIKKEEQQKNFYISKKDENQYNSNIAMFYFIKMRKYRKVSLENITDMEKERSSSE